MRIVTTAAPRGTDDWGSGAYEAPRGDHTHEGTDFCAAPGDICLPIRPGAVTKLGYPYADDLSFHYVEVEDHDGFRARYFYINPCVSLQEPVGELTPLGTVQTLQERYPGIPDHIHVEVRDGDGNLVDPMEYIHG